MLYGDEALTFFQEKGKKDGTHEDDGDWRLYSFPEKMFGQGVEKVAEGWMVRRKGLLVMAREKEALTRLSLSRNPSAPYSDIVENLIIEYRH